MKKTTKHKELIKELKQKNKCTVSPQDIYMNTDFFDKDHNQVKSPYKLAFIISLVFVFVSITFISILGVQNYKLATSNPEIVYVDKIKYMIDDSKGMPEEEKMKVKNGLDYFDESPICTYAHDDKTTLFIYYGYNINEQNIKTYYYYYAFYFAHFSRYVNVSVKDNEFKVDENNRYGLLTTIDGSKVDELIFSVTVESLKKTNKYVFDASNY